MKKTINITIEEEHYNWLKDKNTNISAWIRCLIVKKYNEEKEPIFKEDKEINEIFGEVIDAKGTTETN
jgi:post-segregation antitoxin (ccd killing protein)